jgi:RNA recognition motif-containing protein
MQAYDVSQDTNVIGRDGIATFNIFVGDLSPQVGENELRLAFLPCGAIHSVLIMRDKNTGASKGYGFVHFRNKEAQQKALKPPYCNQLISDRACRVNPSDDQNTLFVGNLAVDLDESQVCQEIGSLVTNVTHIELKTGPPPTFQSRGFAFVTFNDRQAAEEAKCILSTKSIRGRQLNVKWADPRREVDADTMSKVRTLYVSNINLCVTLEQLQGYYSQFGEITNCVIVKNSQGMSKGFAFVEFEHRSDCEQAMKYTKNHTFCGQPLNVVLAKPPPGGGPGVFGSQQAKQQKMASTSTTVRGNRSSRAPVRGPSARPGRPPTYDEYNPPSYPYSASAYRNPQSPYQSFNQYNQAGYGGQYPQYAYQAASYPFQPDQSGYNQYGVYNPQGGYTVPGAVQPNGNFNSQGIYNPSFNYGYNPQGAYNPQGGYTVANGTQAQTASAGYPYMTYGAATAGSYPTEPIVGVYPPPDINYHPPAEK